MKNVNCGFRMRIFFIPQFSQHYILFKYNYTIPQLKEICKHYKLPRTGTKNKLMTYIYNFLLFSKHATIIQKICAWVSST